MFNAYFGMFKNFAQVYSLLFIVNVLISGFIILYDNKKPISTLLWVIWHILFAFFQKFLIVVKVF